MCCRKYQTSLSPVFPHSQQRRSWTHKSTVIESCLAGRWHVVQEGRCQPLGTLICHVIKSKQTGNVHKAAIQNRVGKKGKTFVLYPSYSISFVLDTFLQDNLHLILRMLIKILLGELL